MQRMLKEVLTIRWKRKTLLHLVKDDTGLFLGDYLITENEGSWVTHFHCELVLLVSGQRQANWSTVIFLP